MPPSFSQAEGKPRSRSPAVVVKKTSAAQVFTDEGHFPRHYDRSWRHAVPQTSEANAIRSFQLAHESQDGTSPRDGYRNKKKPLYIDASDYEIYTFPEDNFFGELHSLDHMDLAGKKLLFNGVLSIGSVRHYVQDIPVRSYSIDGYGVDDDPKADIYINSLETSRNREYDIWYKLGPPSRQYRPFQEAFQWVATLGKHVVDFLEDQEGVSLADFRQKFDGWLQQRYPNNPDLSKWRETYGTSDFRKVVHAHISYLWSEAVCLQNDSLLQNQLWDQCGRSDNEMIEPRCAKTVATPHVYRCFKNRYFAGQITEMEPSETVQAARDHRIQAFSLPPEPHRASSSAKSSQSTRRLSSNTFNVGDIVSIAPDEYENQTWRKIAKDVGVMTEWFGYVQHIKPTAGGRQRLYVIWLYRPEDTTISTMDYPYSKELFMSNNCNCEEHELLSTDVSRRLSVELFSKDHDTPKEFFVRMKYETKSHSFVTLGRNDFRCTCRTLHPSSSPTATFRQGETVYLREKNMLEPVVVEETDPAEQKAKVRRLVRLNRVSPGTSRRRSRRSFAANELAWTEDLEVVPYTSIDGKCDVRFFSHDHIAFGIPFPYGQGGTGHCWVLSMRLVGEGEELEHLTTPPHPLLQGPDYSLKNTSRKLSGLSLFSGLGNLDKGLEAAGAVHFHTSVDMNGRAIQTLRANTDDPDLKLWFGSVDDYLHALLSENTPEPENMKLVAKIGDVGVIAAGSPCPGFSKLQQDWQSEQSLRNAAHVTTFASFVDIYRPEYGFLENVVNMGATRKGFEEELVLSQLVGCLVSMGYQCQQFIMSSWNYGSPQHRNRLIISIAAPGRRPIIPPRPTHGDPHGFNKSRSVGKLLNGERFGVQDTPLTPFPHFTPGEALGHLPNLGCGIKHPCIRYPDHVLRLRPNIKERRCMAHCPTDPPGVGLEYAVKHGLIPKYLYEGKSEISGKSYKRIRKDGLIGTIVTTPSPHDSRAGPFVHWEQNRAITLEEARIGQNIPNEEVLIGNVSDQFKMVGNAVDRRVSKALGLELRRAMERDSRRTSTARQSVAVVINVKKQSISPVPGPITAQAIKDPLIAAPNQDVDMADTCHRDTTNSSRSTSQGVRDSTEAKTSISSRSTVEEPPEEEEDTGPIPQCRRRLQQRLSNSETISSESKHQNELEAQLEAEFGIDLHVKPGGFISDDMVKFDVTESAPGLACSQNGFPGFSSRTLSAVPSPSRRRAAISVSRSPAPSLVGSLSASPALGSSNYMTPQLPLRAKRPRHQHEDEEPPQNRPEETVASKRARQSHQHAQAEPSPAASVNSKLEPSRKTRHSGLSVEVVPKNRSKTVETNFKAKSKPAKRPYA